jgi:putative phosphoesterase
VKIVIVSDIHGNYDALSRLPEKYDELWVLGDLVNYGPQPKEVVEFVRSRAAIVLRGNHDHSIGYDEDPRCTPRYQAMADATRKFSASVLNDEQKRFLRSLPLKVELTRDNKRFYLCHAMPSDPLYGYCPQDSSDWISEAERSGADFLLVGHTHIPFIRKIGQHTVANPGSLGQPKTGKPNACYAVWQNEAVELKSFPYPVAGTVEKIKQLPVPREVQQDLIAVVQTGSV